ncbi:Telomere stability and silencing family protein [Babesia bovis T2Bo]|uniref:SDE2-like domain-containing protein n=1 Tax=Babesia bovis TaxID=5865 RepID=A7AWV8_BABBO|nr:Telomere stability and silencing family protein [Babesia bovis T2Bo]EDO05536.1 Telomere stability and silencing family protein [Babesia bovis T2Bo]|eukprot:XP_001609104.1 hypothetical protein [Babesia bovis T2Bo]
MTTCIVCFPNGTIKTVNIDSNAYLSLYNSVNIFEHNCPNGHWCRYTAPCLEGNVLASILESIFLLPRDRFRITSTNGLSFRSSVNHSDFYDTNTAQNKSYLRYIPDSTIDDGNKNALRSVSNDSFRFKDSITINVTFRLLGGKGGFGALLKGKGQRKKQSSNIDSCRTLTGERVRQTRLRNLIQGQRENRSVHDAAKLPPQSVDTDEGPEALPTSPHQFTMKHETNKRKELRRITNTITKGLINNMPTSEQTANASEVEKELDEKIHSCFDIYELR